MLNNNLILMHMIQTTLEDIQKWWGKISTEINILLIRVVQTELNFELSGNSIQFKFDRENSLVQLKLNIDFFNLPTTLLCYDMSSWYTTQMMLEWYAIKMGINRLEIDWRLIFEYSSTKYSKWMIPLNLYIFSKYIPSLCSSFLKFFENLL